MSPLVCVNARNNGGDSRSFALCYPKLTKFTHRFPYRPLFLMVY